MTSYVETCCPLLFNCAISAKLVINKQFFVCRLSKCIKLFLCLIKYHAMKTYEELSLCYVNIDYTTPVFFDMVKSQ
jgi:hypothetical protein